jgi:hypothetical protein
MPMPRSPGSVNRGRQVALRDQLRQRAQIEFQQQSKTRLLGAGRDDLRVGGKVERGDQKSLGVVQVTLVADPHLLRPLNDEENARLH